MAKDNIKLMEEIAQTTAEKVIAELIKKRLFKDTRQTTYQKTETLLYNYNDFKSAIEDKKEQIKIIASSGIDKKSKSITSFSSGGYFESKDEEEKAFEQIERIQRSISVTENFIKVIDEAVNKLANDPYYEIINLKYFEKKTRKEIAEYFEVDERTITRNKNKLINSLKINLFSDDVIIEMIK